MPVVIAREPMSDSEALQQLVQISRHNTIRSDDVRQMELLQYWADELAKPRHADPKRLLRYGFEIYSQCDEDGIIQEIFCPGRGGQPQFRRVRGRVGS